MPWGPLARRGYGFQGTYDPQGQLQPGYHVTCDLVWAVVSFLEEALDAEEPSGRQEVFYGDGFRVRLVFIMVGRVLKNYECLTALSVLNLVLAGDSTLNSHAMQATISRGGENKLGITYMLEPGQPIHLGKSANTELEGRYYADRVIPLTNVRNVINRAIAAAMIYASTTLVDNSNYRASDGDAMLCMALSTKIPGRAPIALTYGDLVQFLSMVKTFYDQRRGGFDLRGGIFYGGVHLGIFNIVLYTATHRVGIGNGTIGTIGNTDRICAVTNGSIDKVGEYSTQQNALQGISEVTATL